MIWLLVLGCAPCVVDWEVLAEDVDQCDGVCFTAALGSCSEPVVLSSDRDGELALLDPDEAADTCVGPLSPGVHVLTLGDGETRSVTSHGFGYALGLERDTGLPVVDPPALTLGSTPVFEPGDTGFDAQKVLAPTVVNRDGTEWLAYAGTSDGGTWGDYRIGLATRAPGEPWQRSAEPAMEIGGDFDAYGQNTPEWATSDTGLVLYYNGRASEAGELSIGRARLQGGVLVPGTAAVFGPSGEPGTFDHRTVAHPSVVRTDGLVELWYAGGGLEIGYALSADGGETFTRYCDNPVFSGLGESSWDLGQVKAPEVRVLDDRYVMSFSGCDKGCYQLGWAESFDGLHWAAHDAPWLAAGEPGAWAEQAVQEGFLELSDGLTLWFAGTDGTETAIGVAAAAP